MKDAYSFDVDADGLQRSYEAMHDAYGRVFTRCGLTFRSVKAQSGEMGGDTSQEFMAVAAIGEDDVRVVRALRLRGEHRGRHRALPAGGRGPGAAGPGAGVHPWPSRHRRGRAAPRCARGGSGEGHRLRRRRRARARPRPRRPRGERVRGRAARTHLPPCGGTPTRTSPRTPRSRRATSVPTSPTRPARSRTPPCEPRTAGSPAPTRSTTTPATCSSAATSSRPSGVRSPSSSRATFAPSCGEPLRIDRGIEVGHVFQLGDKYSLVLGATFTDEAGAEHPMLMGCYGIGVSRILSAVVEEHHDDAGIAWPPSVAPYRVHIVVLPGRGDTAATVQTAAEQLYDGLRAAWRRGPARRPRRQPGGEVRRRRPAGDAGAGHRRREGHRSRRGGAQGPRQWCPRRARPRDGARRARRSGAELGVATGHYGPWTHGVPDRAAAVADAREAVARAARR